jgi:hypothetical protein
MNFLAAVIILVVGLTLLAGCPGQFPLPGGPGTGTLAGIVTNSITGSGIDGVTIEIDPSIEDVEITTAANGTFSQTLPSGVYELTFEDDNFESQTKTISVIGGITTPVNVSLIPTQSVIVNAKVEGTAVPGATLTATATVEVLDGSATVQGYSWAQSNSAGATIAGANSDTATVTLPEIGAFKDELINVLAEPPIGEDELPSNVELPEGEFPGGLQDRFQVVGINPFALEEAGLVTLTVSVNTSAGTFTGDVEIHTELPWKNSNGLENVPIGIPVLLQGKTQASYNWALALPEGSSAALNDATTQNPYFTPDVSGLHTITVTNLTATPTEVVTLEIYAGTWQGAITGQDADGRPLAANCTICHDGSTAADQFTPWAQTGHAEIFSDNLNTSTHYGESCFACHTVGFDPEVSNGGIDEASDYADFLDAGLLNNPGDNWTTVLGSFPNTASSANIQCENCHGPNNTEAHTTGTSRINLAADVCAVCHGEPLRHARFQQWQLSAHANYEVAIDEGESGSCSRCHTANGFLAWLPVLLDDDPATDPQDDVTVTWTADETHPQTCIVCHDPHSIGTTSGSETDVTVRISGNTPPLAAGFTATGVGRGAICMTCHNSRRGKRNDNTFATITDPSRAPHGGAQTDVLMGHNAYLVEVGVRGSHSFVENTCVNCHMVQTPPPDLLSYNQGGTNHTFFAGEEICANCHEEVLTAENLETAFEASSDELQELVEDALLELITDQIAAGNTIDLNGEATITDTNNVREIVFGEYHGRQAITVTLGGTDFGPFRMNDVNVLGPGSTVLGELYDFADERLIKAGWNWNLVNNDGSKGIHNPPFVFQVIDAAVDALNELAAE